MVVIEQFWCPVCRGLYESCWSDPDIADAIHRGFVPVRVDASRHPDVDRRFRAGGWPTVAFLTPDAELIANSAIVSPDVLANALDGVTFIYSNRREDIVARMSEREDELERMRSRRTDPAKRPSPWMTIKIIEIIDSLADRDYGGFGTSPKFPAFDSILFLLNVHKRVGDDKLLKLATDALDAMMQCGLYDWDNGGFFRSSDNEDWSNPRPAKLLIDQARHIEIYLKAYEITGGVEYREAVEGAIQYCLDALYDSSSGMFFNSQYAELESWTIHGLEQVVEGGQEVDRTIITTSNCRMIRSLRYAAKVLNEPDYIRTAQRAFSALKERLCPADGFAFHCFVDGKQSVQGLLADQVELGLTLLDAGDHDLLAAAVSLAERIHDRLADPQKPGYFDAEDPLGLGLLWARDKSFEDNMSLAAFFACLAREIGDDLWNKRAVTALSGFTGIWEQAGIQAAAFGLALMDVFGEQAAVSPQ